MTVIIKIKFHYYTSTSFFLDSLPVSFCGDCLFVVGTNIERTAKIIGRTAKIAITTEGLGRTEPLLSRSVCVTRDLEKFWHFGRNTQTGWQHFKKKVLETFILNEHTQKNKLNDIDIKNTKNWYNGGYGITMY